MVSPNASCVLYGIYILSASLVLALNFCPYYSCVLVVITTCVSNNFGFVIQNKKFPYERNLVT